MQVCLSPVHHVETDGGTEHLNTVLEQYLQCFINFQQDNWVDLGGPVGIRGVCVQ